MSTDELACTYASLILHDAGVTVTSAAILKLAEAANVKVTPFWPNFFENQLKGQNLDTLILTAGSGAPAASTGAAATGAAAAAEVVEEAKAPSSESEEEEMDGFDLF
eukprot:TRINITY_DN2788_c0_g1_i1.p4 TRINITY_DN2788_c0_g1~~TRINITY_DN2788_c0_g1_i1.p4  ORF type:complete len:107 (+),score=41.99 TRINITY_DN2788_c0_g1_i1:561-881(+)